MPEKLCLKWNDFQENVNTAFGSLRGDNEFADVTLACKAGQQIEADKVILAASSPLFQSLLKRNRHPHPLIFMRGVKSEDLLAIIEFLYSGEANVFQENLDSFLAIAEELKLKGLVGGKAAKEATSTQDQSFFEATWSTLQSNLIVCLFESYYCCSVTPRGPPQGSHRTQIVHK